jgi:hypothetical protein
MMEDIKKIQEFFSKSLEEMMSIDDQAKAYFLEKFKKGEINYLPDNPKAAFLDQMMKDEMEKDAAQFRSERGLEETNLSEAFVPSNIKEFAKRKGVSSLVNTVAGWAERVGRRITGGTAIGKNYDTLILDMRYQDSAIRINTENETVELYDEPVRSFQQFKKVYEEYQEEEESVNELDTATYRSALQKGRNRGDSKGKGIATSALNLLAKKAAQTLAGQSFEVAGSLNNVTKGISKSDIYSYINQALMTFTGVGELYNTQNINTVGSDEVHFLMDVEFQLPDNIGGFASDVKFRGYQKNKFPNKVQFSIKNGKVWVWFKAADTDLEFTRQGARAIAKLADMIAQELQLQTPIKHNSIKQFDAIKPVEESIEEINDPRVGNPKFGPAPQQFADLRAKLGDEALLDKIQMIDVNSLRNILDELDSYNLQEANTPSNYSEYSNDALSDMIVNLSRYEGTEDLVKRVKDELENRRKKAKGEMKEGMGGQLDEKYFIEVSVRDARKALNIYDDMFDGAGIEMYGSNVYASNDFGDLYDLYMSFMSSNIEIIDSTDFDQEPDDEDFEEIDEVTKGFGERFPKDKLKDFIGKTINYYGNRYKVKDVDEAGTLTLVDIEDREEKSVNYNMFLQKGLIPELKKKFQEAIKLSEGVIEEELCPKGKAYLKRRKAAGEKSSAYLSGRAVKVCKGLMSGTSKKK